MTKNLLVIGGCGYIGSHTVKLLLESGYQISVIDDLSSGYKSSLLGGLLIVGDYGDQGLVNKILTKNSFDGVLHFASLIQVGESTRDPLLYYRNNVAKTLNLFDVMVSHGTIPFVFSSSAAVYGNPNYMPIDESHPLNPTNPYGKTKQIVEGALKDISHAYGLRSVALRYYNAAGADPLARIGERHYPETHLIPLALQAALGGHALSIFGSDYDTPDGTCIRDYIHVEDIACAHLHALEYLWSGGETVAINLGNGNGYSVKDVISEVENVTGRNVLVEYCARRDGDPDFLIADATLAHEKLGWLPKYPMLKTMVEHAWGWEQRKGLFQ